MGNGYLIARAMDVKQLPPARLSLDLLHQHDKTSESDRKRILESEFKWECLNRISFMILWLQEYRPYTYTECYNTPTIRIPWTAKIS